MTTPARHLILFFLGVFVGGACFMGLGRSSAVAGAPSRPVVEDEEVARGRDLARVHCATCHLAPDPIVLDRVNWGMAVLPEMAIRMGLSAPPADLDSRARAVIRDRPTLSIGEWRAICAYYLHAAPDRIAPAALPPLELGLRTFEVILPDKAALGLPALTSLVKIDPSNRRVFVGTLDRNTLTSVDASGRPLGALQLPGPPVDVELREGRAVVTTIGSYEPSDRLEGKVLEVGLDGDPRELVGELPRPVDTTVVDVDGDGKDDLLVCGFGNNQGRLAWYRAIGGGQYEERVLADRPGAVSAGWADVDGDGDGDVVAMFAQAREGIVLFVNAGGGRLEQRTLTEEHPGWGSSHLELVDFDQDGDVDLLTTNGDNGDHPDHVPPRRPYHGVRLYRNDGQGTFALAWFIPLNGAYRALARDFDLDGDLDVAAVSFFPDLEERPNEGFVYLENQGAETLVASSFQESLRGRWLTLDAGDLDGDGDEDLVLGAMVEGPTHVPPRLQEAWREHTPAICILRNRSRDSSGAPRAAGEER